MDIKIIMWILWAALLPYSFWVLKQFIHPYPYYIKSSRKAAWPKSYKLLEQSFHKLGTLLSQLTTVLIEQDQLSDAEEAAEQYRNNQRQIYYSYLYHGDPHYRGVRVGVIRWDDWEKQCDYFLKIFAQCPAAITLTKTRQQVLNICVDIPFQFKFGDRAERLLFNKHCGLFHDACLKYAAAVDQLLIEVQQQERLMSVIVHNPNTNLKALSTPQSIAS